MRPTLLTHEVGSLAKPSWRTKTLAGIPLNSVDIQEAKKWGDLLNIDSLPELLSLLQSPDHLTQEQRKTVAWYASLFGVRFFEKAGLDILWDGEQQRYEMYEHAIRKIHGFISEGHVRSFDNKYYAKFSCESPPSYREDLYLEEYLRIVKMTQKPVKIPVIGPYTLVDWSYDKFYSPKQQIGIPLLPTKVKDARWKFLHDMAKNVIQPTLKLMCEKGAKYIQIDEPAATTHLNEVSNFVEAIKVSIGDLAGKASFSLHVCFSDYHSLFPQIKELEGYINEIHLELANRDSVKCGNHRPGYEILKLLKNSTFNIGVGVIDVHTDFIESPELIRDRILFACETLEDPTRVLVAPDCGLRTRSWDIAFAKLQAMVEGRNLALQEIK